VSSIQGHVWLIWKVLPAADPRLGTVVPAGGAVNSELHGYSGVTTKPSHPHLEPDSQAGPNEREACIEQLL
jgi:hypothetical protein